MGTMPERDAPVGVRTRAGVLPVDEDELVACVACGLCLPHCPTYRVTGLEQYSPRGRIAAMRAVELDGAPLDAAFRDTIETCVRGCEAGGEVAKTFSNPLSFSAWRRLEWPLGHGVPSAASRG